MESSNNNNLGTYIHLVDTINNEKNKFRRKISAPFTEGQMYDFLVVGLKFQVQVEIGIEKHGMVNAIRWQ